jgi:hypothetical protein
MLRTLLGSSLVLVATACGSKAPTGVVVVTSEVPVPEEVNELVIQVRSGGSSKLEETYRIVPEAGIRGRRACQGRSP